MYDEFLRFASKSSYYSLNGVINHTNGNKTICRFTSSVSYTHLRLKKVDEKEVRQRVMEMLEMVGLKGFERRSTVTLSGGQQQRVAIARSLVNHPRVLLLDEPLGALDLKLRKEMQIELKRIQQSMDITFIYVTHDQEEALTMSDTVVVMRGGNIQQIGSPQDIYNEPKNAFVADFIGESNILDGVMLRDFCVEFAGNEFTCVDKGFGTKMCIRDRVKIRRGLPLMRRTPMPLRKIFQ